MMDGKNICGCPHHKMVPLFIFLIGLAFILERLAIISSSLTSLIWPVLIMLIGLQKMSGGMCKCCKIK
jgi:hypothetical protein